jgi:hypothetical protein
MNSNKARLLKLGRVKIKNKNGFLEKASLEIDSDLFK